MNMSNFSDTITNIERALEELKVDQAKVEKGVTKAARRVRKHFQFIAKSCKEGRAQVLALSKQ